MTDKDKLKQFVLWCAANAQLESKFLYPEPGGNLDYFGVLEQMASIFDLSDVVMAAWVDEGLGLKETEHD